MPGSEWVYAALAVLLGVHLVTLAYTLWVRRTEDDGSPGADAGGRSDGDVCRCSECGTENDPGYRFCRNCIAELPGATSQAPVGGGRGQPN